LLVQPNLIEIDKDFPINWDGKKIGLALSGGGFRASFFHLGVLASLAEKNILKNISIISTVSGGSIIGALYIQKLKERLLLKNSLSHLDYINLVLELEVDFISAVSKNIRSKLFLHPLNELRSVFINREQILGQLYKKHFYRSDLTMDELKGNNIPKLIINATYLGNGGHWYFSQKSMGQYSDGKILGSIGELSYHENKVFLGDAVAASSAVPGLFNYIKIKTNKGSYKLVDGGAFDNLGIFALQKEKCDYIILSDGSRQMTEEQLIPRKRLSVLKRSYDASLELNKKLMLENCTNYFYIHLKENHKEVNINVSEALSKLRTDLNNFSDLERNSLSYYAYLLTDDINKYVYTAVEIESEFGFKDNDTIMLMKNPNKNFLNNLRKGSKLK
jgi:NTE family protein